MRRTDKEITDHQHLESIIRDSLVCRLAVAKDNVPYVVPVSFGYDGTALYLHTAPEGRKIDFFRANPQVCFEFERQVELRRDAQTACKWSMNYESVIGYGTISELVAIAEKEHALQAIMHQYSGKNWAFEEASLAKVRAWKIMIASMTGKRSQPKTSG